MAKHVCICVPTYNSGKTIERTVISLLNQTYKDITIHVVDNASTDNTVDIVESFGDPRVILHKHDLHFEHSEHNWNRCFAFMKNGEYSGIFHSDDVYSETMIKRQVDILDTHECVGAVFTVAHFINDNNDIINTYHFNTGTLPHCKDPDGIEIPQRDILIYTLKNGNQLMTPSALYRSEVYKLLSPFRYEQFKYSSDLDMWLRTAKDWNLFVINEPLMSYRISDSQGSKQIHELRTSEEMFFYTVDTHISDLIPVPENISDAYEMRRIEDKVTCIINSIKNMGMRFPPMAMWGILTKLGLNK
jgi:glycosyltransferase involved in cell wall biosynthesis